MTKKTLNLGCGERIYKEYPKGHTCINMDSRKELQGVDVIGNVKDLSRFKDETFSYILASDIIEHFPIAETVFLLKEWGRVLVKKGTLEIRTPNLKWAAEHYINNGDAKFISYHLFGAQTYKTNYHYVVFDGDWLVSLCFECGLKFLEYKEEGSNFILKVIKRV